MKSALPHILIVDDDTRLRALLRKFLTDNEFMVVGAESAASAREHLKYLSFDLIVLDVMMPKENGFEFLKTLRQTSQVPVLMLTAQNEIDDRITGLESGADDYLAKPFEPKELLLRIRSVLKRQQPQKHKFDTSSLTSAEEQLLNIFVESPGKAITRAEIAERIGNINERAVDVQINRLRKKIEDDPQKPVYIQSVRGIGYKLNV